MRLLIDDFNEYYKSIENNFNNSELRELKKYGNKRISQYINEIRSNKRRLRIKKNEIKML